MSASQPHPLTIELPGTKCGSFACFYTNDEVKSLNLTTLTSKNTHSIIAYTNEGVVKLPIKNFSESFKAAIQSQTDTGIRIEGIPDTTHPEPIQAFLNVQKAYGNNVSTYTTYKPLVFHETNVYALLLHFKQPIHFSYYRKGLSELKTTQRVSAIAISMHQSCQTNLADIDLNEPSMFQQSMEQIKRALTFYHDAGKFHGDIKLRNMVLCDDAAKLIDFNGKTDGKNNYFPITSAGIQDASFTRTYHLRTDNNEKIRIDGALYDRICFNILVGNYCQSLGSSASSATLALYQQLEYPDATKLIQKTTLTADYSYGDVVGQGLRFIRSIPPISIYIGGLKLKKTTETIVVLGRKRCIYVGRYNKKYIKVKGTFQPLSSVFTSKRKS